MKILKLVISLLIVGIWGIIYWTGKTLVCLTRALVILGEFLITIIILLAIMNWIGGLEEQMRDRVVTLVIWAFASFFVITIIAIWLSQTKRLPPLSVKAQNRIIFWTIISTMLTTTVYYRFAVPDIHATINSDTEIEIILDGPRIVYDFKADENGKVTLVEGIVRAGDYSGQRIKNPVNDSGEDWIIFKKTTIGLPISRIKVVKEK